MARPVLKKTVDKAYRVAANLRNRSVRKAREAERLDKKYEVQKRK